MSYLNHAEAARIIRIDVGTLFKMVNGDITTGDTKLIDFAIEQAPRKYLFKHEDCIRFRQRLQNLPARYKPIVA